MRIRTALAVTALAAAALMGASGTALANDEGYHGGFRYENLGGPAGITEAGGYRSADDDRGWSAGFAYENLGGPAGITHAAGHGEGGFDD
ncbi:hypothetical protein AB0Q95_07665 [Streptomyces sp. NPDC059900]|uniref:hypothetical protein n=1 Tax=Streptomyces sp. NPDC059900 TaxID=3155816 RepID=UPI00341B0F99